EHWTRQVFQGVCRAALATLAAERQQAGRPTDTDVDDSPGRVGTHRTSDGDRQRTNRRNRLYRAIVKAGRKITPGQRGKRKKLAQDFKDEIAEIAPGVDPETFVKRAHAYCWKDPSRSRRH